MFFRTCAADGCGTRDVRLLAWSGNGSTVILLRDSERRAANSRNARGPNRAAAPQRGGAPNPRGPKAAPSRTAAPPSSADSLAHNSMPNHIPAWPVAARRPEACRSPDPQVWAEPRKFRRPLGAAKLLLCRRPSRARRPFTAPPTPQSITPPNRPLYQADAPKPDPFADDASRPREIESGPQAEVTTTSTLRSTTTTRD